MNIGAWVNDSDVRAAYKELGLDYARSCFRDTYNVAGTDPIDNAPLDNPADRRDLDPGRRYQFRSASPVCTLWE